MAICETLKGKYIDLVVADIEDAEFTLGIRNNPELTKYIPIIEGTVENQKKWISTQRGKDFDVFFVIKKQDGESVGTLSYYDYNKEDNACEIGRFISYGNAFENIEAVLLMLDLLFERMGLTQVIMNTNESNGPVISLWSRFGAVFNKEEIMTGWTSAQYILSKDAYLLHRCSIAKLLRLL